MEDPTPTPSSSKGLPQDLGPSREALILGKAMDLRVLRDIPLGCRVEPLVEWAACSMDNRSVIIKLGYFDYTFILTPHNLSSKVLFKKVAVF